MATTTQTVVNKADPWTGQMPYLSDLYANAQGAYNQVSKEPYWGGTLAGPNATQTGALSGINAWATGNANLGGATRGTIPQLQQIAGNGGMSFGAGQGQYQMGPQYNWSSLQMQPDSALSGTINGVAGAAPNYGSINLKDNINNLRTVAPNYTQDYNSAVLGATAPIMQQFTNQVLPALSSQHALTGGSSVRHKLQDNEAVSSFGRAIGDTVASKGLELAGLNAGTFNNLSGLAGSDVSSLRALQSGDWQTLVNQAGSAFGQGRALSAADQMGSNQSGAASALGREQIGAGAYADWGSRALTNQGQALTGQGQISDAQLRALGMVPGAETSGAQLGLLPWQTQLQSGGQQQAWTQAGLDDEYQNWLRGKQAPFQGLDQYSSIINGGGSPGGASTSNTTTTGGGASGITQALKGGIGGALTGSALATAIPSLAALGPAGWLAMAGGGLGALLGII